MCSFVGTVPTFVGGTALAVPLNAPSDRGCLLAWNAPSNRANRVRLLAARPIAGLSLLPGTSFSVTWTKGSAPKQTSTEACLLTVAKSGQSRIVEGRWHLGRVTRWNWGRWTPTTKPFFAIVKLLSDGRVAKIYSH
jgi:hypothetical protein